MAKKQIKQVDKSNIEEINDIKKDKVKFSIPKSKLTLVLKMLFVAIFIIGFVRWTDSKRWFQTREANSQYTYDCVDNLLKEKKMDIVFVGNSHAQTINPFVISQSFKCNSCVYSEEGLISESLYYLIEDLLERQQPKLLCVETYPFLHENVNNEQHVQKAKLADRIDSESRKWRYICEGLELERTPLYYSRSLRNHEILFDSVLLNQGIRREKNHGIDTVPNFNEEKYQFAKYGAFFYYGTLSDSLLAAIDSIGPLVDGKTYELSDKVFYNAKRITELCKDRNVPVLFYCAPIFHKVFVNYENIHDKLNKIFTQLNVKWLDFQYDCDTLIFGKNAYYDNYVVNMHLNKYANTAFSYMLLNYINDSLNISFPDRSSSKKWQSEFAGKFDYYFISDVLKGDTVNKVMFKNVEKDGVLIKEMFCRKNEKSDAIYAKVKKEKVDSLLHAMNNDFKTWYDYKLNKTLHLTIKGKMNGREMVGILPLNILYDVRPIDHYVFKADVIKGLEFLEIQKIEIK